MMFCYSCKTETQFGWTEPDRQGFLVPISNSGDGIHHIWVDPGFQYRQEATQNLAKSRGRNSR